MKINIRILDDKYDAIGEDIPLGELAHLPDKGETIHIKVHWLKKVAGAHWCEEDELVPLDIVRREFMQYEQGWEVLMYCVGSERYGYGRVFRKYLDFKQFNSPLHD